MIIKFGELLRNIVLKTEYHLTIYFNLNNVEFNLDVKNLENNRIIILPLLVLSQKD